MRLAALALLVAAPVAHAEGAAFDKGALAIFYCSPAECGVRAGYAVMRVRGAKESGGKLELTKDILMAGMSRSDDALRLDVAAPCGGVGTEKYLPAFEDAVAASVDGDCGALDPLAKLEPWFVYKAGAKPGQFVSSGGAPAKSFTLTPAEQKRIAVCAKELDASGGTWKPFAPSFGTGVAKANGAVTTYWYYWHRAPAAGDKVTVLPLDGKPAAELTVTRAVKHCAPQPDQGAAPASWEVELTPAQPSFAGAHLVAFNPPDPKAKVIAKPPARQLPKGVAPEVVEAVLDLNGDGTSDYVFASRPCCQPVSEKCELRCSELYERHASKWRILGGKWKLIGQGVL